MSEELKAGIDSQIQRLLTRVRELEEVRAVILANPDLYKPYVDHAVRVWSAESDMVWGWLCRPLLRFRDLTPLAMIGLGRGGEVSQVLGAIEYGVYM